MLQCGFGVAIQAQHAQEPVPAQSCLAENFRQPAGADAAVHLHLPQPILGVAEAGGKGGISFTIGLDMGDAVAVAHHLHRLSQA